MAAKKKTANPVSKKELERAQDMWERYNVLMKWMTVSVCVCLAILAAAFIR